MVSGTLSATRKSRRKWALREEARMGEPAGFVLDVPCRVQSRSIPTARAFAIKRNSCRRVLRNSPALVAPPHGRIVPSFRPSMSRTRSRCQTSTRAAALLPGRLPPYASSCRTDGIRFADAVMPPSRADSRRPWQVAQRQTLKCSETTEDRQTSPSNR